MLELQGKYNKCKVFTDEVDSSTIGQLIALMNQESTSESQIRIMPDCHAGKGSTIGTTMTITNKIIPKPPDSEYTLSPWEWAHSRIVA